MKLIKVVKKADSANLDKSKKAAFRVAQSLEDALSACKEISVRAKDFDLHEAEEVLEIFDYVHLQEQAKKLISSMATVNRILGDVG